MTHLCTLEGIGMNLKKSQFRECGRLALEQRGFKVERINGPGILQGARLRAIKGSDERTVAVRTSLDREISLTRHLDGRLATIPRMDEIIVVGPSADGSDSAEVFSFAPGAIISAFDAALEARLKEKPDFSPKAPIFVALDGPPDGRQGMGLKADAQWQTIVPLKLVPRDELSQTGSAVSFIERVKAGVRGVTWR